MRPIYPTAAVLAVALLALTPAPALAQIYAWRDPAGHLVLSDRRKDPSARTYAVASSQSVRATRPSTRRTVEYDEAIDNHAGQHGVRPDLVRAVIQQESGFNPKARSGKGAMGLMQLMPATAASYGVVDPYNPFENIRAGVAYLKSLLVRYDNREELALAAYNAGPGAVDRYGGTVPPYRETIDYVHRITGSLKRSAPAPSRIYRSVQFVDGRQVVKYTNVPLKLNPTPGSGMRDPGSQNP